MTLMTTESSGPVMGLSNTRAWLTSGGESSRLAESAPGRGRTARRATALSPWPWEVAAPERPCWRATWTSGQVRRRPERCRRLGRGWSTGSRRGHPGGQRQARLPRPAPRVRRRAPAAGEMVDRARVGRLTGSAATVAGFRTEGARAARRRGFGARATACAAITPPSRSCVGGKPNATRGTLPARCGYRRERIARRFREDGPPTSTWVLTGCISAAVYRPD